ncbi:MAG: helix-turn-helix domain-containing protein [Candidatus Eremiobacteraeota bacterium]|nr:helix-turn-helix domain-containing protein [Candidatus Eremiobacteraeota bacterium]
MPTLGDEFRAAREARHLSLSDVAEQIHIRSVYLESIERGDWTSIAAPVYVRGFLRSYARFLGLDAEEAVAAYNVILGESGVPLDPVYPDTASRGPSVWVWIAGIAALGLVAFVAYNYYQFQSAQNAAPPERHAALATAKPVARAASTAKPAMLASKPAPGTSAAASGAPGSPEPIASGSVANSVAVRVSSDSWMRVVVDGKQMLEAIVPAGTTKTFVGKSVTIRAGNAGGVSVTAGGKDVGILGARGDVVERTFSLAQQ